ncbi:MAG: class I SAM-dependent methyltransferase [Betaproteobacteria bacterium]|nr:class I SAM-dependent methyltransferase [Betaproteobacteria bacterium]
MNQSSAPASADPFPLAEARTRYQEWTRRLRSEGLLPVEFLLPRLEVPCSRDLPAMMASGARIASPGDQVLRQRIRELGPWGYGIQLRPGLCTAPHAVALERMIYRSHLIAATVRSLLGEAFAQARCVDFACNHGYFSLELAYQGMREAAGFDLRAENVAKARFLKDYFGIANARFEQRDIYDLDPGDKYDVVLNLGVLYHITDPYKLMELSYKLCTRFAVVDSIMHKEPVSAFLQMVNKDTSSHAEGKFNVELHPTYRAVIDLMYAVGFKQVIEVVRAPLGEGRDCPHELYDRLDRRCLIGFKEPVDLPGLRPAAEAPPVSARRAAPAASARGMANLWRRLRGR